MQFFIFNVLLLITINATFACECGIEGSVTRIFKGSKARDNKYPWLAHIRIWPNRRSNTFRQCGGALIDETHVVTAAHCVVGDHGLVSSSSNIDVFLGRVKALSDNSKPSSVSAIWVDPEYESTHLSHDFAVLTLSKSVKYSQKIGPICLPNDEDNLSKLKVAGWGTTSPDSSISDDLMEVEVDFINKKDCNEIKKDFLMRINGFPNYMRDYVRIDEVAETHLCAINKQTKGDACEGDSGGPIMHKGANDKYYLMGVVSGSWSKCGESEDSVGLYTRTLYYKDIIKSIAPNACWQD